MPLRRVFVAILVSQDLQKEFFVWQKKFLNLPVKWVVGSDLHITLIPPWYEDDLEKAKKILCSLQKNIVPFEVIFDRITYGPNIKRFRLIWARGDAPSDLVHLKSALENAFQKRGERNFLLHLTLARFQASALRNFPIQELHEKILWKEKVSTLALIESHLDKEGAHYEVIEKIVW